MGDFSALSLTLPAATIVGLVSAAMWATYMLTSERNRIDKRIDRLVASVEHLATSFDAYAKTIENALKSNYSFTDHELWCAKTENLNPNWKSASLPRSFADTKDLERQRKDLAVTKEMMS